MSNAVTISSASFFQQATIGGEIVARITECDGVWFKMIGSGVGAVEKACESHGAAKAWFALTLAAAMVARGIEPV